MRKLFLVSVVCLAAGCSGADTGIMKDGAQYDQGFSDMAEMATPQAMNTSASKVTPPPPQAPNSENPSSQSFMAYRYLYSFFMPVKAVETVSKTHADMCLNAGPDMCQILSYSTQAASDEYVSAHLRVRGQPKWLESYKSSILSSVDEAKGELKNSSVSAEDLTRAILDTDARLKAKKTLRGRLETHLRTRDAKLGDLLAMERELSRVQGEIESATSNLSVLRKRVSMSVVEINYQSQSKAVTSGTFSPIASALKDFMRDISYGLAGVIRFFAAILPWLVFVILPAIWLFRWIWRRRNDRKSVLVKDIKAKAKT